MATILVGNVSNFDAGDRGTRCVQVRAVCRSARLDSALRGAARRGPKWPETPGVCKFWLIEKNDEVPVVPPCPFPAIIFIPVRFTGMAGRAGPSPGPGRHLYTRDHDGAVLSSFVTRPLPVSVRSSPSRPFFLSLRRCSLRALASSLAR